MTALAVVDAAQTTSPVTSETRRRITGAGRAVTIVRHDVKQVKVR